MIPYPGYKLAEASLVLATYVVHPPRLISLWTTTAVPVDGPMIEERQMERVGIVGCGLMGSGIAEVCARADLDVVIVEGNEAALAQGRHRVERSITKAVSAGKLSDVLGARALERMLFTCELDALADRQLVVEAVAEVVDLKVDVFQRLDELVVEDGAILASNTSSIPIMKLAMATTRPEDVVGIHFFNPVPVLDLVELVRSLLTAEGTLERSRSFVRDVLGKQVIESTDRAGFVVNALLIPYILSAVRMLESGFATAEDIDLGMVKGCAHPMGPLALADLIGLDTTVAIAHSLYDEFKEPLYTPPPLLARMVDAGLLGRKAGRGFYEHRVR